MIASRPCLLIGALWLSVLASAASADGLFSTLDPKPRDGRAIDGVASATHAMQRLVRVDEAKLDHARREVEDGRLASLTFNLAADVSYRVIVEHSAPTSSGYSLAGRIADMPEGRMVLVVNGAILAGTLWTRDGIYAIRTEGAGVHILEKVDPSQAPPLAEPRVLPYPNPSRVEKPPIVRKPALPAPSAQTQAQTQAQDNAQGSAQIDVLVLWTPEARAISGGLAQVRAAVDQMVATANDAYRAGGVAQRVRLAGAAELNYRNATLEDIDRLPNDSNGFLDEIHQIRDSYAADIVSLVVEFEIGGIATLMAELVPEFEALAFNMVNITSEPTIFAHELGHNMGLQHDRYTVRKSLPKDGPGDENKDVKLALFPYSFGYVNQRAFDGASDCWHTIMAYPDHCDDSGLTALSLPRFSHPDQNYPAAGGDPLGVPVNAPETPLTGPTHAVRSLNESRHVVAAFRNGAERCDYTLSVADEELSDDDNVEALAEGGSFAVRVETAAHCAWQAHHQADFMVASPRDVQTGPGEVVYQVQPNPGQARTGVVSIAAESFAVRQFGLIAPMSVCARSSDVRSAIVQAVAKEDCAAVTVWDLEEITMLSFFGQDPLDALRANDFQGLVNLSRLDLRLSDGDLSALAGLANLRTLTVTGSGIVDLSPLAGLTRLQYLDLADNRIVDVTPLGGLQELLLLTLQGNAIADLTPLATLTNLLSLDVARNSIDDISPLASLPILFAVFLADNRVEDLSPLAGKTFLRILGLFGNAVSNAAPLLTVPQLAQVDLRRNPLTANTVGEHIEPLLKRGVTVLFDLPDEGGSRLAGWRLALFSEPAAANAEKSLPD